MRGDLGLRVYTSRLLGRDPSLVLHGGGNTSVKTAGRDAARPAARAALRQGERLGPRDDHGARASRPSRLDDLLALARLDALSDVEMARQLRVATIDPQAPAPSVEAILHAILPFQVRRPHASRRADQRDEHADAAASASSELYGDAVVVVDYVMPGFALAKRVRRQRGRSARRAPAIKGMVLLSHGLFTFSDDARDVVRADDRAGRRGPRTTSARTARGTSRPSRHDSSRARRALELAALRREISAAAGRPMIVRRSQRSASDRVRAARRRRRRRRGSGPGDARPRASARSGCRCSAATSAPSRAPTRRTSTEHAGGRTRRCRCSTRRRASSLDPRARRAHCRARARRTRASSTTSTATRSRSSARAAALDGVAGAAGRTTFRRRVLGARAGQAQACRRRAAVPRRGRRDHGRGVRDRQGLRRGVPRRRAPPSSRSTVDPAVGRRGRPAPTSSASSATSPIATEVAAVARGRCPPLRRARHARR